MIQFSCYVRASRVWGSGFFSFFLSLFVLIIADGPLIEKPFTFSFSFSFSFSFFSFFFLLEDSRTRMGHW